MVLTAKNYCRSLTRSFKFKIIVVLILFYLLNYSIVSLYKSYAFSFLNDSNEVYESDHVYNDIPLHEIQKNFTEKYLADKSDLEFIFIGGYARSGTTLMRAIIDVSSQVNCGPETKVLPLFLEFLENKIFNTNIMKQIKDAHLNTDTIHEAIGLFMLHILEKHNNNTNIHCTKDPSILLYMDYLHFLFPKSKFVFMVRDGRAAVFSLLKHISDIRMGKSKFNNYLLQWNNFNNEVLTQCRKLGPKICIIIRYEDLIMNSEKQIRLVINFLNLKWTDDFLHHEKFIGNKVVVSDTEWSTDQIKKKIYNESLTPWIGNVKYDKYRIAQKITMLKEFGYTINMTDGRDGEDLSPYSDPNKNSGLRFQKAIQQGIPTRKFNL